ncbi:hypothetical protein DSM21852_11200 [Methylocystis bryophila]|nr:hypothetical protein DSM21852_11200 [Methylocystis bryophila]
MRERRKRQEGKGRGEDEPARGDKSHADSPKASPAIRASAGSPATKGAKPTASSGCGLKKPAPQLARLQYEISALALRPISAYCFCSAYQAE